MKLDRLLGIVTVLLRHDRVTAPYLADKFEVSRRTIGRDIDALCQAGIPVVTYPGGGGGIAIAEGFRLDKSVLTAGELLDLTAALKAIGSVSPRSRIEQTLDKLSMGRDAVVSLQEPVIIDLGSYQKDSLTVKIEQLKKAILEQRLVEFDYYYEKGESHRRVEPYFVIFHWTAWYLLSYCLERQDWRLFKLRRLWNLSLCSENYTPRDMPPETRDLDARFPDDKKLVALFDPSVKYQLIDTYGPSCFTLAEDGRLRLEIGYTNREYTISWLLGFGWKVRVLEPEDMAAEIRGIAVKMLL